MHYDAIVIGSGAGGGTVAHVLARAGKRVAIIERGGWLPREPENTSALEVFGKGRYTSAGTWYDRDGRPFRPQAHYNVGGATKMYGAALFRLRPDDFNERTLRDGTSPAWPLSYGDMEPWYSAAEQMYHVRGCHGEDPTEGPWSRQYPHPAVPHEPRIQRLSDALEQAGYSPFHAPCGVLPARGCILCGTCDGFPCRLGAKADAEAIAIRPIRNLDNVTLMTGAQVTRIFENLGSATHVEVMRNGKAEHHSADVIIVSAGAVNSAALLLRSGLTDKSGQLGGNYMCHRSQAVMALTAEPNPTQFQKTLAVNNFYEQGLGSVQMLGKSSADAIRGESWMATLAPHWSLEQVAAHAIDLWLTTEDLPREGNRVTVDEAGRIHLSVVQSGAMEAAQLYRATKAMLREAGVHGAFLHKNMPLAAIAHQSGTARFGNDPATSVLDKNCRMWGYDNLFVVDSSFMPSVGAANPALTVMANALRVGDHIAGLLD
jgi:choline dehydrogenase-like flavoprotein